MKNLIKQLQKERTTYSDMVNFCTDNMIMNNSIVSDLANIGIDCETYSGSDRSYYNADGEEITEEEFYELEDQGAYEEYDDIFQFFIIPRSAAERFAEYTNELIYYVEALNLYILGVKHFGTAWNCTLANWKSPEEFDD